MIQKMAYINKIRLSLVQSGLSVMEERQWARMNDRIREVECGSQECNKNT